MLTNVNNPVELRLEQGMWTVQKEGKLYFREKSRDKALGFAIAVAEVESADLLIISNQAFRRYKVSHVRKLTLLAISFLQ